MLKQVIYLGADEGFEVVQEIARHKGLAAAHVVADPVVVAAALETADAVLDASMKVRITGDMLARSPRLKMISTATTGSDHIDHAAAEQRNIQVRTLKEDRELLLNLTPAAELSWGLVLAVARRLVPAAKHTQAGSWVREQFPGLMLRGRTLGLVGCGRIGQWMARYGKAFGMRVVGYDPYQMDWPEGIEGMSLSDVAKLSDVFSIHVHLSNETRGLVSRDVISAMKLGVIFINTSRGAIADESALLDALLSGQIGGAGLDVLEGEPDIADHPLIIYSKAHDNLIVTPHCGGFSPDAVRVVCAHAMGKIVQSLGEHL